MAVLAGQTVYPLAGRLVLAVVRRLRGVLAGQAVGVLAGQAVSHQVLVVMTPPTVAAAVVMRMAMAAGREVLPSLRGGLLLLALRALAWLMLVRAPRSSVRACVRRRQ